MYTIVYCMLTLPCITKQSHIPVEVPYDNTTSNEHVRAALRVHSVPPGPYTGLASVFKDTLSAATG